MNRNNPFIVKCKIQLIFSDSKLSEFAYKSYLPDLNARRKKRSYTKLQLKKNSLIFNIESSDITSFRSSVNEIINLGKIIDDSVEISNFF